MPMFCFFFFFIFACEEVMNDETSFSFSGTSHYFIWACNETVITNHLDNMVDLGLKVLRIFLLKSCTSYSEDCEGYNACDPYPDVEDPVGVYHDDLLKRVDFLMYEMSKRDLKLIISFHDRWSLGCWRHDAYVKKYNIPTTTSCSELPWVNDPSKFYEKAIDDFKNRAEYILNHTNPYFNDRPWKDLDEVIFMIEPENESQFFSTFLLEISQAMKEFAPKLLVSLGGVDYNYKTPTVEDLQKQKYFDVFSIHDYSGKMEEKVEKYKQVVGKRFLIEEFGFPNDDKTREEKYSQVIKVAQDDGGLVPYLFWCIGENCQSLNVCPSDQKTWSLLKEKAQYFNSHISHQNWPEIWGK